MIIVNAGCIVQSDDMLGCALHIVLVWQGSFVVVDVFLCRYVVTLCELLLTLELHRSF